MWALASCPTGSAGAHTEACTHWEVLLLQSAESCSRLPHMGITGLCCGPASVWEGVGGLSLEQTQQTPPWQCHSNKEVII